MTRPAVSVVMPFAGTVDAAQAAVASLLSLTRAQGDELIVADNSGSVRPAPGVTVVSAHGERSPARARNAGATRASNAWILFLDADCIPVAGLLDAYFEAPVDTHVGALAGGILPAPGESTLATRYATARNFLSPEAHLAHPYRPRAAAANLLVRRAAFEDVGGFYEGLRAAEDTDFCWRMQDAGWRLEIRPRARVEHRYRTTVAELRRQWRGYAAGRAWLARRYEGFTPEPGLVRAVRRRLRGGVGSVGGAGGAVGGAGGAVGTPGGAGGPPGGAVGTPGGAGGTPGGASPARPRGPRAFLALDALLALEELAGFALSNRPAGRPVVRADLVLVADSYPDAGVLAPPTGARVEAARRPPVVGRGGAPVTYREDDGVWERALACAELMTRHPLRCAAGLLTRSRPGVAALAPAALRLAHDPGARVQAAGGDPETEATARRLADLAGAEPAPVGTEPAALPDA